MSDEQFNHIDDKIKAAAHGYQPSFNEAAWEKMEQQLNEQDRKKRGLAAWWLLLPAFLLIGGAVIWWNHPVASSTKVAENNANKKVAQSAVATNQGSSTHNGVPAFPDTVNNSARSKTVDQSPDAANSQGYPKQQTVTLSSEKGEVVSTPDKSALSAPKPGNTNKFAQHKKVPVFTTVRNTAMYDQSAVARKKRLSRAGKQRSTILSADVENGNTTNELENDEAPNVQLALQTTDGSSEKSTSSLTDSLAKSITKVAAEATAKTTTSDTLLAATKQEKLRKQRSSKWYVLAVGGISAASVKFPGFSNGKAAGAYGISLGYQLNQHWSVEAGFFAGRKKYIAGSNDYKTKPGSYWQQVTLHSVDADCLVYELPISIKYSFKLTKGTGMFVGSSISSVIMKKEDYGYDYTRNNYNYYVQYGYTGNQHLFAALGFQTGLQKQLSAKWSVLLSPYISIPLKGVGEGKVQLFSTGMVAGLKFQPGKK